MRELLEGLLSVVIGVGLLFLLLFGVRQLELSYMRFLAPKVEEIKHEVWSNTTERIEGMNRQLSDLHFEYLQAEVEVEEVV